MKKLLFAFALIAGAMFAACGNFTSSTTDKVDSVAVDSTNIDSTSVDSVCLN